MQHPLRQLWRRIWEKRIHRIGAVFGLGLFLALFFHEVALAQFADFLDTTSSRIIDQQIELSQGIDDLLSSTMETTVESEIFRSASNVGVLLALIGFGPTALELAKAYHWEQPIDRDLLFKRLGSLALILLLLGPPGIARGELLGDTFLQFNGILNEMSKKVLVSAGGEHGFQAITQAVTRNRAEDVTARGITECAKIPERQDRANCFGDVREQVITILQPFGNTTQWAPALYQDLLDQIGEAANNDIGYGSEGFIETTIGRTLSVSLPPAIEGVLWAVGSVFIIVLEHIKVLTVTVGPIFLGLTLIPLFNGSFGTWLKGFVMLELTQMMYNVVVSLIALTVVQSRGGVGLIFPFVIALTAIGLGLALATGGGIAIFSVGSQFTRSAYSIIRR